MSKDTVAWISIMLVLIAVVLAVLRQYYAAWGVIGVNVALLVYAVRKR